MGLKRLLRVGFVVALVLVPGACGGLAANTPEVACSADLAIGAVCLPGEEQRGVDLFDGIATESEAARELMDNPLGGAINSRCTSLPGTYTICVSSEGGITLITPIEMPENGRVSFEGDDNLEDVASVRLDQPLGLRRQNAPFTVLVRDADDKLLGTIGLGFYP